MNGLLIINKPANYTSRDVVNIVSKKLNTRKVGHTGTLDPLAMGVLVLCVGRATKLVEIFTNHDKEYIATIVLGIRTETLDLEGEIVERKIAHYKKEDIIPILNSFIGEYNQEVPLYSAVRIDGKKLYEYARNREEVTLPKRQVSIKDIALIEDVIVENDRTTFKIKVTVSKGTYIRSLVNDIAVKLNTIGTMKDLIRTRQGNFILEDAIKLDEITSTTKLIPINSKYLDDFYRVKVDKDIENKLSRGQLINNIYNKSEVLFVNSSEEVIAIYHEYDKDKSKLKPWKMLK